MQITLLYILSVLINIKLILCQDVSVVINSKKSMHIVDERFISVVIDPVILMSGLNISSQTFNLAKHFAPGYLRIHGPSTGQIALASNEIKSSDDPTKPSNLTEDLVDASGIFTLTPSMWRSLNTWIINTNLTPVFALSDQDRINDAWNPKATALPLMALTDKMNITCYWELSNDTPGKTLKQYSEDVISLRHILDAFPSSRKSWYTVGGDYSKCPDSENNDVTRKLVTDIESHLNALDYTKPIDNINVPAKTHITFGRSSPTPAIWITAPRTSKPTSFKDGLIWAKQLGDAATNGYEVLFRQPKIRELFELTPAYWVSAFHKILMGRNVLGVRHSGYNKKDNCYIYANCAKRQNRFTRRGAATVFVINEGNEEVNASVKFLGAPLKNVEIQSYVLTSPDQDSSETYLNGQLLTISDLHEGRIEYMPKLRRARASKSLLLTLPRKSIGFFVIPAARLSTCIHGEEDLHLIRQEMQQDQQERWNDEELESEENNESTSVTTENGTGVQDLFRILADELDSNEKYYRNRNLLKKTRQWLEQAEENLKYEKLDATQKVETVEYETLPDGTRVEMKKLIVETNGPCSERTLKEEVYEYIPPKSEAEPTISDSARKLILLKAKRLQTQNKILDIEQRRAALKQLLSDRKTVDVPQVQVINLQSFEDSSTNVQHSLPIIENNLPTLQLNLPTIHSSSPSIENKPTIQMNSLTPENTLPPTLLSTVPELTTTNSERINNEMHTTQTTTVLPMIAKHFSGLLNQFSAFKHQIERKRRYIPEASIAKAENNQISEPLKRASAEDYMVNVEPNNNIDIERNSCGCQRCNKCSLTFIKNILQKLLSSADDIKNSVEETFVKRSVEDSNEKRDNHIPKNREQDSIVADIKTIAKRFENQIYNLLNSVKKKYDSSPKIDSTENGDYKSKLNDSEGNMRPVRSLSERMRETRKELRSKIELRKEKLRNNWIEKRNNRIKRELLRKKIQNDIHSERKFDNIKVNKIKKLDSDEFTPIPEKPKLSPQKQDGKTSTAHPVTVNSLLPKPIRKTNSRINMLNRRLTQQKKLEERLAAYLKKIKQSNNELNDEIKRTKRSVKIENHLNDIDDSKYSKELKMDERNKEILNKFKHSHYEVIVKRQVENGGDINRTDKFDEDNTKEDDIFMNEIPKEGKMESDWTKENADDAYMIIKPKFISNEIQNVAQEPEVTMNEVVKEGRMRSDKSKENEDDSVYMIIKPKNIQNGEQITISESTTPVVERSSHAPDTMNGSYGDEIRENNLINKDYKSSVNNKEIQLDKTANQNYNVFATMFDFLSNVYKKIEEFIQFISK